MDRTKAWLVSGLLAGAFAASPAQAVPFGDGGASLQGIMDGFTTDPAGNSSIDAATDAIPDGLDSTWAITGSGGSFSRIVVELAGFANTNRFGVYDVTDPGNSVELFAGPAGAGDRSVLEIGADGSVYVGLADTGVDFAGNTFGFYLDSSARDRGGFFYSDTSLNGDGADHMAAYQGNDSDEIQLPGAAAGTWTDNEYLLAWEDLAAPNADYDYNDFVVMVESVETVAAPGSLALLGLGLLGMAGLRRRHRAAG